MLQGTNCPCWRAAREAFCMPKATRVGTVTVTYNSEGVIDAFLQCMLKQDHEDFTLYIIDNCSTDSTLDRVSRYQDSRIVVIANQHNVGVAEGNNQGIRASLDANCQYVLLINNDTEFSPNLLSGLYEGCQQYQCDMIVPKITYYDKPDVIWYAGAGFSRLRGYSGPHWGVGCKDTGQFDVPRQVDYAPTCCMFLRADVFRSVGLMDARYFVYFDDTDFCFRARRSGQKLFYMPSVGLLHKVSSLTGGGSSLTHILYTTRNHVYYLAKNLGWLHCSYYLPLYQLKIAAKLVSGRLSVKGFRVSQVGFWEGVRMSVSQLGDDGDRLASRDVVATVKRLS
jgi:GT2 family glycosyltransferase